MNNIFLNNNDPLLFNSPVKTSQDSMTDYYGQLYKQQLIQQAQNQQQNNMYSQDWIGDLDRQIKELEPGVIQMLQQNEEYTELNQVLQNTIQNEMINIVKVKLNCNGKIIENIQKQQDIIKKTKSKVKENENQSYNELNDYIKNYSHLTFDEYKKIKSE